MSNKNILAITQWSFEDGLIQSYTLPYLKIIHKNSPGSNIFLITQEGNYAKNSERLNAIKKELAKENIYLLQEKYYRRGALKYLFSIAKFFSHVWFILTHNIQYVHSFCTPAGSYAYLLAKLTRKKLIVDSFEPHSQYMLESGVWKSNSFSFRLLKKFEKKMALSADHLIITAPSVKEFALKSFDADLKDCYIKPACIDLTIFNYSEEESNKIRKQLNIEDKVVCVYVGKFGDFYQEHEVFDFLKVASEFWGNKFHVLLISELSKQKLHSYCVEHELNPEIFTLMTVPFPLLGNYLSAADFAISPYKPTPSKRYCTPMKDGIYWAIGLPVIIPDDISIDSDIIRDNDIGYVLGDLTTEEYEKSLNKINELLKGERGTLRKKIRDIAVNYRSFSIAEKIYKSIYQ